MVAKSKNTSAKGRIKSSGGNEAAAPQTGNGSGPSNRDALRKLYASLLRCRLIEEQLQRASNPARYEFVIGEEAVAVGAAADLDSGDTLAASPRDLAALVAGGVGAGEFLDSKKGHSSKPTLSGAPGFDGTPGFQGTTGLPGTTASNEGRSLLSLTSLSDDPFVLATGIALAHKLARKQHVVIAISREASSLEPWGEAFQMAVSQKLPVVYVVKKGAGESAHDPHLQPISFMARQGGFPGIVVDGQDAVAVRRVVQESVHRARNRGGPTLIDCRTEPGRDPLAHLEHYMRKRDAWDSGWRRKLEAQIRQMTV